MKRITLIFVSLALLLVWAMLSAFSFMGQTVDWTDLGAVLTWVAAGPGAIYLAGLAFAYFLEIFPVWGSKIPSKFRPWIVFALMLALSYGATLLLGQAGLVAKISPQYTYFVMLVFAWLGSQVGYASVKANGMRADRSV
jgi:hypothetical protein